MGQETPEDARNLPFLKDLFGRLAALGEEVENSFEDGQVFAGEGGAGEFELFVEFLECGSTPDDLFFVVRPVYRH